MPFRTVEVTRPSELHVEKNQLRIEQDEGVVTVALEDITNLVLCGVGIRISAGALAVLAHESVMVVFCDSNHRPSGILTPVESNSRQALVV